MGARPFVGISLGWNCTPAIKGVQLGLRTTKADGYQTCPFDLMMSTYKGMTRCLETDFQDFYNPVYLILDSNEYIRHSKYGFVFNHESPGHPSMAPGSTKKDKYYYTVNNFAEFIKRYKIRVDNFRRYVTTKDINILFIVNRYNQVPIELEAVIRRKYPQLKFKIACFLTLDQESERIGVIDMSDDVSDKELVRFKGDKCKKTLNGRFLYLD